jgi:hypothetical protein
VGKLAGEHEGEDGNRDVDAGGTPCGDGHVMDAQKIKAGDETAGDGAGGVAAVEEAKPGNAAGSGFDPPRDGGKRCPHDQSGRQQAGGTHQAPQKDAPQAGGGIGRV